MSSYYSAFICTLLKLLYAHIIEDVSHLLLAFCGNLQFFGSAEKNSHQRPEVPGPGVVLNYNEHREMIKHTKHHDKSYLTRSTE